MERVGTLINKLKEQFDQQSEPNKLLLTAQMLLAELQQKQTTGTNGKVAVILPNIVQSTTTTVEEKIAEPEVVVQPVQVLEPAEPIVEVIEEPVVLVEPIVEEAKAVVAPVEIVEPVIAKVIAPEPVKQEVHSNAWMFDTATAIPTLAHHGVKEVFELNETIAVEEETESHNEKLKQERVEVAAVLQGSPVKDLKKAIGINDRYLFINELFRGDEAMYERSIKTINSFSIYPEAEYWIQREMKTKLGWIEDSEAVKLFDQLVKRRFS